MDVNNKTKADWLEEMIRCPECASRLYTEDKQISCSNSACNYKGWRDGNVYHLLPEFLDEYELSEDIYRKHIIESFDAKWSMKPDVSVEILFTLNQIAYYDFYSQYRFFRDEFVQRSSLEGRGLELGGGAGQASGFIKLFYPNTHMVMADIAPINMKLAEKLAHYVGFTTDYFVSANVECLPFVEESFDFIFSSGMLHHIGELAQALRQVHATLKKDGLWYVINEPSVGSLFRPIVDSAYGPAGRQARLANVRENSYTWQEWCTFFINAGFEIVQHYWHRNPNHKLESWWRAAYYAMISHCPEFVLKGGLPCEVNFVLRKI